MSPLPFGRKNKAESPQEPQAPKEIIVPYNPPTGGQAAPGIDIDLVNHKPIAMDNADILKGNIGLQNEIDRYRSHTGQQVVAAAGEQALSGAAVDLQPGMPSPDEIASPTPQAPDQN